MMGRLTSEERRRIFLLNERARLHVPAGSQVSTAAIDRGGERRRRRQWLPGTVLSFALATGGLLFYAFVELHAPASLLEAFLPRW
jgi:hypothetical protein